MTTTDVDIEAFGAMARRCEAAAKAEEGPARCAELSIILARRYPDAKGHLIPGLVVRLQQLAAMAHAYAEELCNGDIEEEEQEEREAKHHGIAADLAADMWWLFGEEHLVINLGRDPRGPCCYLKVPGVRGDGWDPEEGFAVYGGRAVDEEG